MACGAPQLVQVSARNTSSSLAECFSGSRAKLVQRANAANLPIREQHEPIADAFGVAQLMDGENEAAPPAGHVTEHAHDLARLPQIEAIERLVHEKHRLRREQRERQHQPTAISFR